MVERSVAVDISDPVAVKVLINVLVAVLEAVVAYVGVLVGPDDSEVVGPIITFDPFLEPFAL